jgi:type I restriction enzyme S subunit
MNKVKKDIIPELRFPTFEKGDNWKDVKLIDVTDKNKKWSFTGGPFGSNLKSSDYVEENEGIRIIQLQNIGDGEFKNDYKIYTSKEKADELLSCNIYPGDIIMSKMGDPVGRACLIPDYHNRYVMSSDGIRIAVDEDKYDKYFIYLVINSKIFRSKVENSSTGSTRKRIGLIDLKKLTLNVPTDKEEQQKIANCLSSLDNLIIAETEKLTHLKDHKKGLLQQLFPAKGETKPQFRFPEFKNDEDWEEIELDHLCKFVRGPFGGALKKEIFVKEGFAVYEQSHAIYNQFKDFRYHINEDKFNELKRFAVKLNDIIMSCSGTMGKFSIIPEGFKNGVINQALLKLTVKKGLDLNFIKTSLELPINQKKLLSQSAGGAIKNVVGVGELKKIKISIPSLLEQQKVAKCVLSVDNLIEAQTTKIEALKDHKKGLMQQLFPNVND